MEESREGEICISMPSIILFPNHVRMCINLYDFEEKNVVNRLKKTEPEYTG